MSDLQRFHLHLVSDSTGETLEAMAKAALVQFENVRAEKHMWPMVRTPRQMERIMEFVEDRPGLVMYTLVNEDIRRELTRRCAALNIPHVSVLDPVIESLGQFLGARSRGSPAASMKWIAIILIASMRCISPWPMMTGNWQRG